jgi:hypothetical protein
LYKASKSFDSEAFFSSIRFFCTGLCNAELFNGHSVGKVVFLASES